MEYIFKGMKQKSPGWNPKKSLFELLLLNFSENKYRWATKIYLFFIGYLTPRSNAKDITGGRRFIISGYESKL